MLLNEEAKAVQEVAKTSGKFIDGIRDFGSFVTKFISGPLEQKKGILEDELKYSRWENQIKLMQKAEKFIVECGLNTQPTNPIPFKLAVPLFQAATLEDDDYLQELWASLLINSSYNESGVKLTRTFIDVLERISSFEARILMKIYELPYGETESSGVITVNLPDKAIPKKDKDIKEYHLENEEVLFALANLASLGCISAGRTIGGGQRFELVNPTILGRYFVRSCALKF